MPQERKLKSLDEIVAAALTLPGEQIDELIDRLEKHLEIRDRVDEYDRGEVEGIEMQETLARLRAMLK